MWTKRASAAAASAASCSISTFAPSSSKALSAGFASAGAGAGAGVRLFLLLLLLPQVARAALLRGEREPARPLPPLGRHRGSCCRSIPTRHAGRQRSKGPSISTGYAPQECHTRPICAAQMLARCQRREPVERLTTTNGRGCTSFCRGSTCDSCFFRSVCFFWRGCTSFCRGCTCDSCFFRSVFFFECWT